MSRASLALAVAALGGCGLLLDLEPSGTESDGGDGTPDAANADAGRVEVVRVTTFGRPAGGYAAAHDVAVDELGNVFVTGEVSPGDGAVLDEVPIPGSGTFVVLAFDPTGAPMWAYRLGDGWGTSVAARAGKVCAGGVALGRLVWPGGGALDPGFPPDGVVFCMSYDAELIFAGQSRSWWESSRTAFRPRAPRHSTAPACATCS
jgi:hypothetical protein